MSESVPALSSSDKPESFQRLENFARALLSVPKEEVDAIEKEEKRKAQKRTVPQDKPAK